MSSSAVSAVPTINDDLEAIARIAAIPNILEVVCRTTGLGFAAVARVTESQWVACSVRDEINFGLKPGAELEIKTTLCDQVRDSGKLVVIDNVEQDCYYRDHPIPKQYGFQSYISVPIFRSDGTFFGTLCGIDLRPAQLDNPAVVGMFTLFAQLIAFHVDAQERIRLSEDALVAERETALLREQFIAVLGHDLRSPLNSVSGGAQALATMDLGERAAPMIAIVHRGAQRMAGLVTNLMDFARGRLGGGITLNKRLDSEPIILIQQLIAETRLNWSARIIETDLDLTHPVNWDRLRIAQLCTNLLTNGLAHGAPDRPVRLTAESGPEWFTFSVANEGDPIPPNILDQLFQPFNRSNAKPGQEGLGLGLYIASEIARAHDGKLEVTSTPAETKFTFRMGSSDLPIH